MSDSGSIPPVFTQEEWADLERLTASPLDRAAMERRGPAKMFAQLFLDRHGHMDGPDTENAPEGIALLNHVLPADDPRKITWATIDDLRRARDDHGDSYPYTQLADALASYLAPREEPGS